MFFQSALGLACHLGNLGSDIDNVTHGIGKDASFLSLLAQ